MRGGGGVIGGQAEARGAAVGGGGGGSNRVGDVQVLCRQHSQCTVPPLPLCSMTYGMLQVEVITKKSACGGAVAIQRYMAAGSCMGVEVWQGSGLLGAALEQQLTSLVCAMTSSCFSACLAAHMLAPHTFKWVVHELLAAPYCTCLSCIVTQVGCLYKYYREANWSPVTLAG